MYSTVQILTKSVDWLLSRFLRSYALYSIFTLHTAEIHCPAACITAIAIPYTFRSLFRIPISTCLSLSLLKTSIKRGITHFLSLTVPHIFNRNSSSLLCEVLYMAGDFNIEPTCTNCTMGSYASLSVCLFPVLCSIGTILYGFIDTTMATIIT